VDADDGHLAFGGGVHYCLGATLARLEGQVAIATVVRRLRVLELDTELPEWRETVNLRGLRALPVRFEVGRDA
jgi:cytochrome P450